MAGAARNARRLLVTGALLLAPVGLLPAGAGGADRGAAPAIDLVEPMRAAVGEAIVIRGQNFSTKTRFSTVVFRGPREGTAFARPVRAFPRKLVVRVPTTVERLMATAPDDQSTSIPTRFRLRVLSERRRSSLTGPRRSPLIVPAHSDG